PAMNGRCTRTAARSPTARRIASATRSPATAWPGFCGAMATTTPSRSSTRSSGERTPSVTRRKYRSFVNLPAAFGSTRAVCAMRRTLTAETRLRQARLIPSSGLLYRRDELVDRDRSQRHDLDAAARRQLGGHARDRLVVRRFDDAQEVV